MKEREEAELHRKMREIEGTYEARTKWGKIVIDLVAIPNYAGGEGRPDEILAVRVNFAILGADVKLSVPVLIELAVKGGWCRDAKDDLREFCERSISGRQRSYLEIPMIVVGGDTYNDNLRAEEGQLTARFSITQVPKRMIE